MNPAQPAPVGQTLNTYQVGAMLGAGGMGVVYKALDTRLQRTVALKFLPRDTDSSHLVRSQLMDEARTASALDHPNIGTIYGLEEAPDGQMFIVMAYYEGQTLAQKIQGPLPPGEAVAIALQIATGLAEAHAHHVVHHDIKPSNVILTPQGLAKIVDFGLARVVSSASATRSRTTAGTAAYMSPEQALDNKAIDHRTDLWSAGVVLYQMLTGRLPFPGESMPAMMYAIVHSAPQEMPPQIVPELQRIVYRALAKDPAERYQTALEMITDLKAVAPSISTSPTLPTMTTRELVRYRDLASRSMMGRSDIKQRRADGFLRRWEPLSRWPLFCCWCPLFASVFCQACLPLLRVTSLYCLSIRWAKIPRTPPWPMVSWKPSPAGFLTLRWAMNRYGWCRPVR